MGHGVVCRLAPGFAGLYQVNVVVPKTPDSGDVSLDIDVESVSFSFQSTIPIAGNSASQTASRRCCR
jgi:uncharacterized protein (TIGR03437 family)